MDHYICGRYSSRGNRIKKDIDRTERYDTEIQEVYRKEKVRA